MVDEAEEKRYFNFPIVLLEGFLTDHRKALNKIFDYCFFAQTLNYKWGSDEEKMIMAQSYFEITVNGKESVRYDRGQEIYNLIPGCAPKVGLSLSIFWDFYKNEKTDFEKVTLLAYLAIRSIIGKKSYCKVTNLYWLSRMDGKQKAVKELDELSPEIRQYATEYQTKKLKKTLIREWHLMHYSRYTRGFYVSFKMPLDELVFQAEKKRKSRRDKVIEDQQKEAIRCAMSKLSNI